MTDPLISIYVPTFNRLSLLKRALSSVQMQTFRNFEVLIVDDRSHDGTGSFLQQISCADQRFKIVEKEKGRQGACASRNAAIAAAQGRFITGLDDDDWFHPMRLEFFLKNWRDDYSAITTNYYKVSKRGKKRHSYVGRVIDLNALLLCNLVGNQVFTLRARLEKIGGFDEALSASQDYDLWLRLVQTFGPIRRYRKPLYFMDCTNTRHRISTGSARDRGTDQLIIKYRKIMTNRQVINRNRFRISSSHITRANRFRNLIRCGPRYVVEAIRSRLKIG